MEVVEVEGESISPEELASEGGWLASYRQQSARALLQSSPKQGTSKRQEGVEPESSSGAWRSRQRQRKPPRPARQPQLPRGDIKIMLRPREGLDVTKISQAMLRDGILRALKVTAEGAAQDTLRINALRNIIVASTTRMESAAKYTAIKAIPLGENFREVMTYAAPPEDTSKGIIHNIPASESDDNTTRSLLNKRNPKILQARRRGRTNSAVIVCEGEAVPYFVYYRGADNIGVICIRRSVSYARRADDSATGRTCAPLRETRSAGTVEPRTNKKSISVTPSARFAVETTELATKSVANGTKCRSYSRSDSGRGRNSWKRKQTRATSPAQATAFWEFSDTVPGRELQKTSENTRLALSHVYPRGTRQAAMEATGTRREKQRSRHPQRRGS
ncbi:hypothetical protein HPB48_003295 [Haemaphysalis longicornis]|uniref:Uncharacterized protein n=1 Tax=Haemaphysalis longicornis TaxID=44386 RepID=A0A9J6GM74_HAELO|nr:hypothetical protein HPB48_003295 [Haemaphysalis longicornis]